MGALLAAGQTVADVARALAYSPTTVYRYLAVAELPRPRQTCARCGAPLAKLRRAPVSGAHYCTARDCVLTAARAAAAARYAREQTQRKERRRWS